MYLYFCETLIKEKAHQNVSIQIKGNYDNVNPAIAGNQTQLFRIICLNHWADFFGILFPVLKLT